MRQGPVFRSDTRWLAACVALAAGLPGLVYAQASEPERDVEAAIPVDHVLDLTAGARRSDNVRRTATNEVEDTLMTVGLVADIARNGPRLDYYLKSDIAWTAYLDDNYSSLPIGYLDGVLGWILCLNACGGTFKDTQPGDRRPRCGVDRTTNSRLTTLRLDRSST